MGIINASILCMGVLTDQVTGRPCIKILPGSQVALELWIAINSTTWL